jgi:hypothetical protein
MLTTTTMQTQSTTAARASTTQSRIDNLANILSRGPGGHGNLSPGGGGQPGGNPPAGGGGGGGQPGGNPPAGGRGGGRGQPAVAPTQPANRDAKSMGNLPPTFDGNRKNAEDFIESVKRYICLNADMAGFNSYIKRIAFTLMLLQGPQVAGWAKMVGNWINQLNPNIDDEEHIWMTFLTQFNERFLNTTHQEEA